MKKKRVIGARRRQRVVRKLRVTRKKKGRGAGKKAGRMRVVKRRSVASWDPDEYNRAYDQGFDEAYNEGYNVGYQEGLAQGYEDENKGG